MKSDEIERLIDGLTDLERTQLLRLLRDRRGLRIHPLEERWNTTAEAILEAIDQAPDLTQRGVRGVLAEATFRAVVLPSQLRRWKEIPVKGNLSYDLLLSDETGEVRVQVKLQRKELGIPKLYRNKPDCFVVETQRTRGGKRADNEASRPYRVDEFDVIAVCLHPATNDWTKFVFCATRDLTVRVSDIRLLEVMQPILMKEPSNWSADFDRAVARFRGIPGP
jgi:hypothetical protein